MANIKDFDKKKKKKKDNKIAKDLASTIKDTMSLWFSELSKTMRWWASKEEIKKQESIFVVKKWNQIMPEEEKREQKKIETRKHIKV